MTFKGMNIIDIATKNFSMIQSKEEKKKKGKQQYRFDAVHVAL